MGDEFACGGPRSSCVAVLRCATYADRGYHSDVTPCQKPLCCLGLRYRRRRRPNQRPYGYVLRPERSSSTQELCSV